MGYGLRRGGIRMSEGPVTAMRLCGATELREGQMTSFQLDDREVIVLWPAGGTPKAYDGRCPHQQLPLADGDFDGSVLVCAAHEWSFSAETGDGISPGGCALTAYPLRIEGPDVVVEITE
jgi:toluene monooxygenase system ferredoxin subunit